MSSVASTPPGFVRTLTRVTPGDLLEQERDFRGVGLGEQIDQALGLRGRGAGRQQVVVEQHRPHERAVGCRLQPVQHAPEQPQLGDRLGAVEAAGQLAQLSPCLHERGGDAQGPRRRIGMGEGRGVGHDAGQQRRRQRAVVDVQRHPGTCREQRHHLARGRVGRVDPVGRCLRLARDVMVDRHPGQAEQQVPVALEDAAGPLERPRVRDDQEVVGDRRIRVGPKRIHPRQHRVRRRWPVGAQGRDVGTAARGDPGDAERRAERVRVGVLVGDREDRPRPAQPIDDGLGHGGGELAQSVSDARHRFTCRRVVPFEPPRREPADELRPVEFRRGFEGGGVAASGPGSGSASGPGSAA